MRIQALRDEENLLWEAILLSLALHFLLFRAGAVTWRFHEKHEVEIDITNMGRIGMPSGGRKAAPAPAKPAEKPKEWLKPTVDQKVEPAPIPTKPVAPLPPEEPPPSPADSGGEIGLGVGGGGEAMVSQLPQLTNLSDLGAILRRFYPEQARIDGREGTVVIDIHLGKDGRVTAVEIVQSADTDFNDAALHVARLLKFTPAFVSGHPVAVKMRQAIQFKLER